MWQGLDAAMVLSAGLQLHERGLASEQAVRGLDAMKEVELQGLIAGTCANAGFGVLREVVYPTLGGTTRQSARLRCDMVLTPVPGQTIVDTLLERRERESAASTLFADLEADRLKSPPPDARAIHAGDCLWVEIKAVAQVSYTRGVPEQNRGYGSELVQALRTDLDKLARDVAVKQAIVVLVLFTRDERTAHHDIVAAANRCLDHAAAIASMSTRTFRMVDRAGNACCTVATFDVLKERQPNAPEPPS